jgi:hypothetical protein
VSMAPGQRVGLYWRESLSGAQSWCSKAVPVLVERCSRTGQTTWVYEYDEPGPGESSAGAPPGEGQRGRTFVTWAVQTCHSFHWVIMG